MLKFDYFSQMGILFIKTKEISNKYYEINLNHRG